MTIFGPGRHAMLGGAKIGGFYKINCVLTGYKNL